MKQLKVEVRNAGLLWKDVVAVYRELRQIDEIERLRDVAIRATVWKQYSPDMNQDRWWRYGMTNKFSKEFGGGDYSTIPGFDLVTRSIAYQFYGFIGEDGEPSCQLLWDYLTSDYLRRADKLGLYREAFSQLLGTAVTGCECEEEFETNESF